MSVTATVSIDRSSLSLSALTISSNSTGTYTLTENGLGRPAITARTHYASESPYFHGSTHVAVTKDQSALPLEVLVQAASSTALDTAINALDAALWQFTYDVTVTVDGVAKVWSCSPASWSIAESLVSHGRAVQYVELLTITIPCYPIPGA